MTASTSIDRRRQLLQEQTALNGVDYVEVVTPSAGSPATQLRVVFVNPLNTIPGPDQIRVAGGDRIPSVQVEAVDVTDDPDTVLVTLAGSGDLSTYTLQLVGGTTDPAPPAWIDPVLASACFTFSPDCMSDLPCDDAGLPARGGGRTAAGLPRPRLGKPARASCSTGRRCCSRTGNSATPPTSGWC